VIPYHDKIVTTHPADPAGRTDPRSFFSLTLANATAPLER
jgi:hypothetical protein